ncbi:hypothetical protein, partial [Brevibacillus agri]
RRFYTNVQILHALLPQPEKATPPSKVAVRSRYPQYDLFAKSSTLPALIHSGQLFLAATLQARTSQFVDFPRSRARSNWRTVLRLFRAKPKKEA